MHHPDQIVLVDNVTPEMIQALWSPGPERSGGRGRRRAASGQQKKKSTLPQDISKINRV